MLCFLYNDIIKFLEILMNEEKIKRINELAHLAKERALTHEEAAERDALRKEYIESFRKSLTSQFDNTYIVDKDGNKRKLGKKA